MANRSIKKVMHVFDREMLTRRALREVATLRHMRGCAGVTELYDLDASFVDFAEIYLYLGASDADLSQIIRSHQALSEAHMRYFTVQLLQAVYAMHSSHFVHRDLKPGNLLVNADCKLRVCDFGLTRAFEHVESADGDSHASQGHSGIADTPWPSQGPPTPHSQEISPDAYPTPSAPRANVGSEHRHSVTSIEIPSSHPMSRANTLTDSSNGGATSHLEVSTPVEARSIKYPGGPLTEYVATRWYRAPEVLLCYKDGYGPPMDMWSVGCIIAELLTGKPLCAGKDYMDQLARMHNLLGSPPAHIVERINSRRARAHVESLPPCEGVTWSKLLPDAPSAAVDLLSRLLLWDPDKRLTAEEALAHPWLRGYRQESLTMPLPPRFERFAEVECIRTPCEFKEALKLEEQLLHAHQRVESADMALSEAEFGSRPNSAIGLRDARQEDHTLLASACGAERTTHTRANSSQSGGTSAFDTHYTTHYDWTPPSSFDSDPGEPVSPMGNDNLSVDEDVQHTGAAPKPIVRFDDVPTPPETDWEQKRVLRKSSSDFLLMRKAREFISWLEG